MSFILLNLWCFLSLCVEFLNSFEGCQPVICFLIFMCMCVHTCLHVCGSTCVFMCTCVHEGPRLTWRVLLHLSSTFFFWVKVSQSNLELTDMTSLLTSLLWVGTSCLHLQGQNHRLELPHSSGIYLSSGCPNSNLHAYTVASTFNHWDVSPVPGQLFYRLSISLGSSNISPQLSSVYLFLVQVKQKWQCGYQYVFIGGVNLDHFVKVVSIFE